MPDQYIRAAIQEAEIGLQEGGIPIGAVLVYKGDIIGSGHNKRVQQSSVIRHAELDALENAGRQRAEVYAESILYTTLSPCPMCTGAILLYKIPKVVIGENLSFMGEEELLCSKGVTVEILQDKRCINLMKSFIQRSPTLWHEDIGVCETRIQQS